MQAYNQPQTLSRKSFYDMLQYIPISRHHLELKYKIRKGL